MNPKVTTISSTTNIMALLKDNTSVAHKQLEKSSYFKRLFADDYTIDEYALLLSYFYGFYTSIESKIFDDLPSEYTHYLQHRKKSHLLYQDLISLGINVHDIPICNDLLDVTTFAKKMGCLYVLEGSLLGGRVIGRHLKEHFGESVLLPLNFYSCYGDNLNTEWQSFSLFMGQYFNHQHNDVINEVIDNANATFVALQQWTQNNS
jgi:heme oxygenase